MPALSSLYLEKASRWTPYYTLLEQQLGATATLLDFGNQKAAGKVNAATWTGRKFNASGLSPVWTPSEALSAFDTPFDLKLESNWLGDAPILTFNGTDEEADTPDAAYWSGTADGTGPNEPAMSLLAWIYLSSVAVENVILSKHDSTTGATAREWLFRLGSDGKLVFTTTDESASAASIGRSYNTALVAGRWYHVVATKSTGVTSAAVNLYLDGADVDDTDATGGVYVAMENTASLVRLGFRQGTAAGAGFLNGKMLGGPWSPAFVQAELTAAQVANIYQNMRLGLGV